MDSISWYDAVRASVGSCLPYIPLINPRPQPTPTLARNDELEGLLAESTDGEDDAMSLHSNIGRGERERRRKKKKRGIQLFGFYLFGRPDLEEEQREQEEERERLRRRTSRILSAATLDADASVVEDASIADISARWTAPLTDEDLAREEEEQRQREERRFARRQRRELKRALQSGESENFEGFPGSGQYPTAQAPMTVPSPHSPLSSSQPPDEEYGPFEAAMDQHVYEPQDIEDADFGGETYSRKARRADRTDGSQSQSVTSSNNVTQPRPHLVPLPPSSAGELEAPPRRKKKSKSSSASNKSSHSATSQSTSLQSPTATSPPAIHINVDTPAFEGFPIDTGLPSPRLGGRTKFARQYPSGINL
ncbi:hypothetical protein SISSUDRAFT_1132263 [Sistotremastrum suecicum HHB10207 ss-3]|uniref:Uncharacterized protein n=1 Tax=Sistotremastrum suecicum HHB10207 ss-3 TaxID=1314776 RepID=A0A165Z3E5_9AGAM|nr:hypothetical protein SISSUDRAFT_1132263 [Sistotremastrum suecicum HHB10207 ss-3]